MTQFWEFFIAAIASSVFILFAIFQFWAKKRIIKSIANEIQIIDKQRNTFSKFLDLWSERVTGDAFKSKDWIKRFAEASKDVLLWCPDSVLEQIALFVETFLSGKTKESEIHFAKAILAFRKTIGYKNSDGNITAEQIVKIFNAGN